MQSITSECRLRIRKACNREAQAEVSRLEAMLRMVSAARDAVEWSGVSFDCNIGQVVDGLRARSQGALAQLVARFHGMEEVRGSSPLSSTIEPLVSPPFVIVVEAFWLVGLALLTNLLTNVRSPLIVGEEQIHRDGSAGQHRT
jgi:hypothetical protein